MKRNLMLILLAALLAVGMVGVSAPAARADNTIYTEGTLYYTLGDGTITIVGCFGKNEEIHVPAMIAGIPVNTIASGAFAENQYVKKVYLPDTISKVEPGAFGSWVKVIYNANTDHPQDTPTDLILGLLTPAATDDPNATEPPAEPTEPPVAPTDPPAAPTDPPAEPKATPKPTAKPTAKATAKATAAPTSTPPEEGTAIGEGDDDIPILTPRPTEEPTPAPTEVPATEAPTEAPVTEAPKATDAPKVVEAKTTDAPVKTEPVATAEPAPAEEGKGSGWIWGVGGAAVAIAGAAVLLKKRRKA